MKGASSTSHPIHDFEGIRSHYTTQRLFYALVLENKTNSLVEASDYPAGRTVPHVRNSKSTGHKRLVRKVKPLPCDDAGHGRN